MAGQERQRVKQQLAEANAGSGKPNLESIFPYFPCIMLDKPSPLGGFMEFIMEFMTHLWPIYDPFMAHLWLFCLGVRHKSSGLGLFWTPTPKCWPPVSWVKPWIPGGREASDGGDGGWSSHSRKEAPKERSTSLISSVIYLFDLFWMIINYRHLYVQ